MKVIKKNIEFKETFAILDIDVIEVGSALPYNVYIKRDDNYVIIIEAGALISQRLYDKLTKQENIYISKNDLSKQTLTPDTLKHYITHNRDNNEKRFTLLYDVSKKLFDTYLLDDNNKINKQCVEILVTSIIYLIKHDKEFIRKSLNYFLHHDQLYSHSLHIAIYSVNIGIILKYSDEKLLQIGTAALLIDIGTKKIDDAILNKPSALNRKELEIIHKHPKYSVDIAKNNLIFDPYILHAIMQHHERQDGDGYPDGLHNHEICEFASIISVCDVFDALTSERPYRKSFTTYEALRMMTKDQNMLHKFDTKYLHIFLKLL